MENNGRIPRLATNISTQATHRPSLVSAAQTGDRSAASSWRDILTTYSEAMPVNEDIST